MPMRQRLGAATTQLAAGLGGCWAEHVVNIGTVRWSVIARRGKLVDEADHYNVGYLEAGDGDVDDSGESENTKDFPDAV